MLLYPPSASRKTSRTCNTANSTWQVLASHFHVQHHCLINADLCSVPHITCATPTPFLSCLCRQAESALQPDLADASDSAVKTAAQAATDKGRPNFPASASDLDPVSALSRAPSRQAGHMASSSLYQAEDDILATGSSQQSGSVATSSSAQPGSESAPAPERGTLSRRGSQQAGYVASSSLDQPDDRHTMAVGQQAGFVTTSSLAQPGSEPVPVPDRASSERGGQQAGYTASSSLEHLGTEPDSVPARALSRRSSQQAGYIASSSLAERAAAAIALLEAVGSASSLVSGLTDLTAPSDSEPQP